jgi:hypothetical protein
MRKAMSLPIAAALFVSGCADVVRTPDQAAAIARGMLTSQRLAEETLSPADSQGNFWVINGASSVSSPCGYHDAFWIPRDGGKPIHTSSVMYCDPPPLPFPKR